MIIRVKGDASVQYYATRLVVLLLCNSRQATRVDAPLQRNLHNGYYVKKYCATPQYSTTTISLCIPYIEYIQHNEKSCATVQRCALRLLHHCGAIHASIL